MSFFIPSHAIAVQHDGKDVGVKLTNPFVVPSALPSNKALVYSRFSRQQANGCVYYLILLQMIVINRCSVTSRPFDVYIYLPRYYKCRQSM